jgi:hypothetical protein
MLRALASIVVVFTASAHACPAPPPMATVLRLVTPGGTTLPPDGALLVERTRVQRHGAQGDQTWTVRVKGGAAVAVTSESLGMNLERWVLAGSGDRELEVVDSKGKVLATVRQHTQKVAPLPAPSLTSMTSTHARGTPPTPGGMPAFTMIATLARKPPADARYLAVSLDSANGMVATTFPIAGQQMRFESKSFGGKNCGYGGGAYPIAAEERVSLFFVDAMGRRSAAAKLKILRPR